MKKIAFVLLFFSVQFVSAQISKDLNVSILSNSYYEELSSGSYNFNLINGAASSYNVEIKLTKGQIEALTLPSGIGIRGAGTTTQNIAKLVLKNGDKIEFVITDPAVATFKKTFTFVVPSRGEWKTTFGFGFIGNTFSKEIGYFPKPSGKANEYYIAEGDNPNKIYYAPAVFFHWMPFKKSNEPLSFSATGGLGIQTNNATPTVFLGGSLTYNQNLSIQIGIAAHQQNFLKPEFSKFKIYSIDSKNVVSGDVFSSTTIPVITEKAYRINPFISLSLRFRDNPFNKQ